MPLLFQKFQAAVKNRTTYRVGLLQAKAYRALKNSTTVALIPFEISTVDWAFLGLLYDNKGGMDQGAIAEELGVERPFVTTLTKEMAKKGFIKMEESKEDSRVKFACITSKGKKFVNSVEKHLRGKTKQILNGVTVNEIATYLVFLEKIIENSKEISKFKNK